MILIDSNILIDLLTDDPVHAPWSHATLEAFGDADQFAVNLIVRAEIAPWFSSDRELAGFLADLSIAMSPLDSAVAWRAGQAFRLYRTRGGRRERMVPDLLIGAHAAHSGAVLLTRDQGLARYFPDLALITPETHPHG